MQGFILDLYSNGDLIMMFSKVFTYMLLFTFLAVILGCFRGMRL